jgi:hypothetical protein
MSTNTPRYNPYHNKQWGPHTIRQILLEISKTADDPTFAEWLKTWKQQHGSDWAEELVDYVLERLPGGADLNVSERQRLARNISRAIVAADINAILQGQAVFGGSGSSDLERISRAFGEPFTLGRETGISNILGFSNNPLQMLYELGKRYSEAKARDDQDTMDTLNQAGWLLGQQLSAYYGGNAGRNMARRIQRASLGGRLFDDLNLAFSNVPGWKPFPAAESPPPPSIQQPPAPVPPLPPAKPVTPPEEPEHQQPPAPQPLPPQEQERHPGADLFHSKRNLFPDGPLPPEGRDRSQGRVPPLTEWYDSPPPPSPQPSPPPGTHQVSNPWMDYMNSFTPTGTGHGGSPAMHDDEEDETERIDAGDRWLFRLKRRSALFPDGKVIRSWYVPKRPPDDEE